MMKKKIIFFAVLFIFSSAILHAQLRKVPAAVTDAFKEKYPKASSVEWKDNLTNFEASFKQSNAEWTAQFSSKGEWKESSKKINFDDLPAEIKDGFSKSKYSNWATGSVRMIEDKSKGTYYKIYAEKKSVMQKVFLYFDEKGALRKEAPGV